MSTMLRYDLLAADPPIGTVGSLQAGLFPRRDGGFTLFGVLMAIGIVKFGGSRR
jgi:hypothetical protein